MSSTQTDFTVVIPARHGSTRLPGKPLLDIGGKSLIQHVCERAAQSNASRVVVATDHEEILQHVTGHGFDAVMTAGSCQSGTDRIAETVTALGLGDDEMIVNLQGDEPFMPATVINQVVRALADSPEAAMSTACEMITDTAMYSRADVVKVVMDSNGSALYFSRSVIPHDRDGDGAHPVYRHLGIYAYRAGYVKHFASQKPCPLELAEKLEQLRGLWHGERIVVSEVHESTGIGVDTIEDLELARQFYLQGKS